MKEIHIIKGNDFHAKQSNIRTDKIKEIPPFFQISPLLFHYFPQISETIFIPNRCLNFLL